MDIFTHQFCANGHGWTIGTSFPYIRTSKRQYLTPVQYTCISSCLSWLHFALQALLPLKPYTRWEITCIAALYAAQQVGIVVPLWFPVLNRLVGPLWLLHWGKCTSSIAGNILCDIHPPLRVLGIGLTSDDPSYALYPVVKLWRPDNPPCYDKWLSHI